MLSIFHKITLAVLCLEIHKNLTKAETGVRVCMESTSWKIKGNELWGIRKYKGSNTCLNSLMNRDQR